MGKKIKKESVEAGLQAVSKEFFTAIIAILMSDKKQKELTYVKTAITMPDGGTYLVSVLHIDGPKLDLETLRLVSESQKEEVKDEKDVNSDS